MMAVVAVNPSTQAIRTLKGTLSIHSRRAHFVLAKGLVCGRLLQYYIVTILTELTRR